MFDIRSDWRTTWKFSGVEFSLREIPVLVFRGIYFRLGHIWSWFMQEFALLFLQKTKWFPAVLRLVLVLTGLFVDFRRFTYYCACEIQLWGVRKEHKAIASWSFSFIFKDMRIFHLNDYSILSRPNANESNGISPVYFAQNVFSFLHALELRVLSTYAHAILALMPSLENKSESSFSEHMLSKSVQGSF